MEVRGKSRNPTPSILHSTFLKVDLIPGSSFHRNRNSDIAVLCICGDILIYFFLQGVPTHDQTGEPLSGKLIKKLKKLFQQQEKLYNAAGPGASQTTNGSTEQWNLHRISLNKYDELLEIKCYNSRSCWIFVLRSGNSFNTEEIYARDGKILTSTRILKSLSARLLSDHLKFIIKL